MAGTIGCGMKTVIFGANNSSLFGSFPVNTPAATVVCFPAKIGGRKFGEVAACATSPTSSTTTRKPRGIMKPRPISAELQELVGAPEISRTQALKVIWAHIKANNLQIYPEPLVMEFAEEMQYVILQNVKPMAPYLKESGLTGPAWSKEHADPSVNVLRLKDPNNKKIIVCDEKLKKIFAGKERVGFLEISGLITPHLL